MIVATPEMAPQLAASTPEQEAPVGNDGGFSNTEAVREELWLPPRRYWLIDPAKEKLETPLDANGVVDIQTLLIEAKRLVDPEYGWPRLSLNPHHFQWREDLYSNEPDPEYGVVPAVFRDLPPLKGYLPRVFENWLHLATTEPPVPKPEVMHYCVESWQVAHGLFKIAQESTWWERRAKKREELIEQKPDILPPSFDGLDKEAKEFFKITRDAHLRGREMYLARLAQVPPEFRLVQPNTSPRKVADRVGRLALKGAHKLSRKVLQAA